MRIHAASSSAPVIEALEAIITASGHSVSTAADAELLLIDAAHPTTHHSTAASITLGTAPAAPRQLIRMLRARQSNTLLPLAHDWSLDVMARALTHTVHTPTPMTEKECALLAALLRAQPHPIPRDTLLAEVWGMSAEIDTHTLETHIYRLRNKLEALNPMPCDINTVDGAYQLALA